MKKPEEKKAAKTDTSNPLGFFVKIRLKEPVTNYQKEHFWEDLAAVTESNGLDFSGGGEQEVMLFVTSVNHQAPAQEAIAALEHWLHAEQIVMNLEIGELRRQMKISK
jgi:uncharacterized protein YggL (DUF469 family)